MMELLLMMLAGIVQGLVTWGALRVELRYLRRDVDRAHERLNGMDRRELDAARSAVLSAQRSAGRPL